MTDEDGNALVIEEANNSLAGVHELEGVDDGEVAQEVSLEMHLSSSYPSFYYSHCVP